MKNTVLEPTFDTESVRILLDLPTLADVRNLTRKGYALHDALIRGGVRGRYDVRKVKRVRGQMIRRKLAEQLGRHNPRFLSEKHSRNCLQCNGTAVAWAGSVVCENGHKYEERRREG